LESDLDQLNAEYKAGLSSCQKKDFVTSHAAFGYLAATYGINQIAISGVSPDEEPSSQKLAEVANLVKQKDIKIIFFESLVSPKLSETIASETGAKTMVLDPIEGITSNDLKVGHTYLTVMRDNLAALQDALQCNK
jgi:zinc transport system substrate-binding protein